jgi:hypothetical protein
MPFKEINTYIKTTLANDTASYLNEEAANFKGVKQYFGNNGYFNEATVQGVMFALLKARIADDLAADTLLVVSQVKYPGFDNIADLAVIANEDGVQRIYIELKVDFNAESVDRDIEVLDAVASVDESPLTKGYAFYLAFSNNLGWTGTISKPIDADVYVVPIVVQPPPS